MDRRTFLGPSPTSSLAPGVGPLLTACGREVRRADLVDTGRRFERMALLAREHGVAVHPMSQSLEEPGGRDAIAEICGPGVVPQLVLRVGYLDEYPERVSPRRPVASFLHRPPAAPQPLALPMGIGQ